MRRKVLCIILMSMAFIGLIYNALMWLNWNILQWNVGDWISTLESSLQNESEIDQEFGYYALDMISGGISIICIINMIFDMIILILSSLLFCKSQKE